MSGRPATVAVSARETDGTAGLKTTGIRGAAARIESMADIIFSSRLLIGLARP
jgi:hypothetical protein